MPSQQLICAAIETAINQALSWSNNSQYLLDPLTNKRCIIYLQEIQQALIFNFGPQHIDVLADIDKQYSQMPDELEDGHCWVSVSIFALDKLKQNNQLTKLIKSGKLDFAGDLAILQSVSRVFGEIDLDFEEILSSYIGDVPAYQLNTSLKKIAKFSKQQFTVLTQTMSDAALDEKPVGVRKIMLVNFCDEVSVLRADVDRFEAKLRILEECSHKLTSEKSS